MIFLRINLASFNLEAGTLRSCIHLLHYFNAICPRPKNGKFRVPGRPRPGRGTMRPRYGTSREIWTVGNPSLWARLLDTAVELAATRWPKERKRRQNKGGDKEMKWTTHYEGYYVTLGKWNEWPYDVQSSISVCGSRTIQTMATFCIGLRLGKEVSSNFYRNLCAILGRLYEWCKLGTSDTRLAHCCGSW